MLKLKVQAVLVNVSATFKVHSPASWHSSKHKALLQDLKAPGKRVGNISYP